MPVACLGCGTSVGTAVSASKAPAVSCDTFWLIVHTHHGTQGRSMEQPAQCDRSTDAGWPDQVVCTRWLPAVRSCHGTRLLPPSTWSAFLRCLVIDLGLVGRFGTACVSDQLTRHFVSVLCVCGRDRQESVSHRAHCPHGGGRSIPAAGSADRH